MSFPNAVLSVFATGLPLDREGLIIKYWLRLQRPLKTLACTKQTSAASLLCLASFLHHLEPVLDMFSMGIVKLSPVNIYRFSEYVILALLPCYVTLTPRCVYTNIHRRLIQGRLSRVFSFRKLFYHGIIFNAVVSGTLSLYVYFHSTCETFYNLIKITDSIM